MIVIKPFSENDLPKELLNSAIPKKAILDYAKKGILFSAYVNNNPAGSYFFINHQDTSVEIAALIVYSNYRNRTIGTKLIEHALNQARLMNANSINMDTIMPLKSFYESFGFREDNIVTDFYKNVYNSEIIYENKAYADKVVLSMFL